MSVINVPALFQDVAERVNAAMDFEVFFSFGHYSEVTLDIANKGKSITQKNKRYPLIWLVMDFRERYPVSADYYCELPDLQLIIAAPTQPSSTTPERIEATFKPMLYPIYEELKRQLCNCGHFQVLDPEAIDHEKIDRPYWGGGETASHSGANLFNDYIDAIQIRKLRLLVNEPVDGFTILH